MRSKTANTSCSPADVSSRDIGDSFPSARLGDDIQRTALLRPPKTSWALAITVAVLTSRSDSPTVSRVSHSNSIWVAVVPATGRSTESASHRASASADRVGRPTRVALAKSKLEAIDVPRISSPPSIWTTESSIAILCVFRGSQPGWRRTGTVLPAGEAGTIQILISS